MTPRERSTREFDQVVEFIADELDFEPASYNDAYLDRRITSRMRRTGSETHREYRRVLASDPDERTALLDALSINVTEFFRNPDVWEALRPILRTLTADKRHVDCVSAACSDGREPYSTAMLARDDPHIDANRLDIVGTDIDEEALNVARAGVYETTTTTDIERELEPLSDHDDYVRQDGDRFEVRDGIKRMVEFKRHDLIRDRPFESVDLLMCRNILIYIDADYKETIFDTLVESLRDGGYLVIGMSETPPPKYRDALVAETKSKRIYRKEG